MTLTRRHFCGLSCAAFGAGLAGCAFNPASGRRNFMLVPKSQEKEMGKDAYPRMLKDYGGVYNDARVTGYVDRLGRRLAAATETPGETFTFTVLDSPIVNAFATPGGYIYVSRGLMALADSEAELAGVIGHELGHVVARHVAQRISKAAVAGALGGLLGADNVARSLDGLFSREQEMEADRLAVRYIGRAGYDPAAMTSFLAKMRTNSRLQAQAVGRDPEDVDERDNMSTHPRTMERVRQAMQLAGARAGRGLIERDSYLQRLDAMAYGSSPKQGYIRDRVFIHPGMRLSFQAPKGFLMHYTSDAVRATSTKEEISIKFDSAEERFNGKMTDYIADDWAKGRDIQDLAATRLGALPAATAMLNFGTKSEPLVARIAAVRFDSKRIFRFSAVAPDEGAGSLAAAFRETTASFRKLGKAEAAALRPWRISVERVRPGDTARQLGLRTPFANFQTERFLALNGMEENDRLAAGSKIKLVVEG